MSKSTRSTCKDLQELVRLGHVIEGACSGRRIADNLNQDSLAALLELDRGIKSLKGLKSEIEDRLLEHLGAGGSIEAGPLVASVITTERRNPAWKEIAGKLAAELAYERGNKFSLVKWAAGILRRTPRTSTKSVKITAAE